MPPPKTFGSEDPGLEGRNRSVREVAVHLCQHLVVGFDVEKVEPTQLVGKADRMQREDISQQCLEFMETFDEGAGLCTVVGIVGKQRLHRVGILLRGCAVGGKKRRGAFAAFVTLVVGRHEDFQRNMDECVFVVGVEFAFELPLLGGIAADGPHPPHEELFGQLGRPDAVVVGREVFLRGGGAVTVLFGIVTRIAGRGDGCREDAFLKGRHRKKGLKG